MSQLLIITIFTLMIVGLFGGLLYLGYLPFKKQLLKSGRLTNKLSRQINLTYIILLGLFVVFLVYNRDYRTPSKERLEKSSNIILPIDFKVLKDEYQDMWQDYCIIYEIQLERKSSIEIIKYIKKSVFYNPNSFHNGIWKEADFVKVDSVRAVWSKSAIGYDFSRPYDRTTYFITFDTLTNKLLYNECAD